MNAPNPAPSPKARRWPRWTWIVLLAAAAVAIVLWVRDSKGSGSSHATFTVRHGPLNISVLEGGSLRALESQEIKCEVKVGYQGIKILKIVEEGYEVSEDDIRTNKVLVEMDSSELQKQITQQDIQFESAAASLTDAQQNYEIQLNQNMSDIKAAEQKVRFARMDFDKFLGDKVTQEVVEKVGLDKELAAEETNALARAKELVADKVKPASAPPPTVAPSTAQPIKTIALVPNGGVPADGVVQLPKAPVSPPETAVTPSAPIAVTTTKPEPVAMAPSVVIDFLQYANLERLGDGEAKQKLRKFDDDLQVAQKEEGQARLTLDGTKRLADKGFLTKTDLQRDEIAYDNNRLKVQTAETARDLFLKYEFPKTAEESLSKHAEAVRELSRARKAAISKLAQAEAKLRSAQGQYNIQSRQRKELYEQLDKCTIVAKKPGLVVYGGGRDDDYYYGGEERIREGASVRERQAIITIPDMTRMSVRVKIHESYIKKIKKSQKARITVDAFPDKVLDGEVTQMGVLPDSQNRWMNPDMKVYLTTITIAGTHDWIKPGMSAKVEIMVNRLADVLYVPVQAVSPFDSKQVCYLANGRAPERRLVEIGEFNDEFIEIKSGLKEGEKVLLRTAESQAPDKTETAPKSPAEKTPAPATAAPAPKGKA
jgi:HlyD family secretion protein